MPVLYMGYLAHYTLLLRKHKGLYSSLYISHQYTEGPRNPVVFAGLFEGTVLIPSCQLIIGLRWIQFSNYKAYCLFQYHFWQFMYGQSRKLLLPASFSPVFALPEGKKTDVPLFSLSSCTILFILCHKIYRCCLGAHTSDACILGI